MSFWVPPFQNGQMNLQATLSSATADTVLTGEIEGIHHPITCSAGMLYLDEDNTMRCDHSTAPPDNFRTQAALDASIAILLFQEAHKKFG